MGHGGPSDASSTPQVARRLIHRFEAPVVGVNLTQMDMPLRRKRKRRRTAVRATPGLDIERHGGTAALDARWLAWPGVSRSSGLLLALNSAVLRKQLGVSR